MATVAEHQARARNPHRLAVAGRPHRTAVECRSGSGRPRRPRLGPQLRRSRRQDPRRRRHPQAIPTEADFDVTRLDIDLPGRTETSGIKRVNFDIVRLFVQPMPHQTSVLARR